MSSEILPSNSTDLERALVEAGSVSIDGVSPDYAAYWDPDRCPEPALPFLAHAFGLPIWRETWSTEKKRWVIGQWPLIAAKLGTEDAIRWAIDVAEAETVRIVTPPQIFFAGLLASEDNDAWEAWLLGLPEIQLQTLRNPADENGVAGELDFPDDVMTPGMFLGSDDGSATFFAAGDHLYERAVLIREGVEREISFSRRPDTRFGRSGDVTDFFWFGDAGLGAFLDQPFDGAFLDGVPSGQTMASVKFGYGASASDSWNCIGNSPYVQDVTPRLGALQDDDHIGLFCDEPWEGSILDELDPIRGSYQSFRIMDGFADGQPALSFLDDVRLGMDAYTAEIMVEIVGKAGALEFFLNDAFADATFLVAEPDGSAVDLVCNAIAETKSLRDDIFVDLDIPKTRLKDARSWAEISL